MSAPSANSCRRRCYWAEFGQATSSSGLGSAPPQAPSLGLFLGLQILVATEIQQSRGEKEAKKSNKGTRAGLATGPFWSRLPSNVTTHGPLWWSRSSYIVYNYNIQKFKLDAFTAGTGHLKYQAIAAFPSQISIDKIISISCIHARYF
jgi:hypothetical protein